MTAPSTEKLLLAEKLPTAELLHVLARTLPALWHSAPTLLSLYLLILDEPTAALDPRSEREVFDSFARLMRGGARRPTTLLITHRLGSVTLADRVVVMRAGKIVQDGTHAELLAYGGECAELWRLQAGRYEQMA